MIVRLDFGGEARRVRALRVAPAAGPGVHVVAELSARLPFKDGSVDEVFLDRTLAHRDGFLGIMEELWRISKPGTLVHARLPHASSSWSASRDARHGQAYTLETFNFFDPRFRDPECCSEASFYVEHARLLLTGARRIGRGSTATGGALTGMLEGFVNQTRGMQYRWERWFAPFVGGFEEFSVVLSAVKDRSFG